jgi:hypothetical protein
MQTTVAAQSLALLSTLDPAQLYQQHSLEPAQRKVQHQPQHEHVAVEEQRTERHLGVVCVPLALVDAACEQLNTTEQMRCISHARIACNATAMQAPQLAMYCVPLPLVDDVCRGGAWRRTEQMGC